MSSGERDTAVPGPPTAIYDEQAHRLVRDLHTPAARVFWTDLISIAALSWCAFFIAIALKPFSPGMLAALVIGSFAFYRGLCFIHEITHARPGALPGFENAWNLVFGVPLLLPSFVYVGVHQDHHGLGTYGTKQDPEYLPFTQSKWVPVSFLAHSVLIPAFLVLRFVVLLPAAFAFPKFHRRLVVHASALSMNLHYRRAINSSLLRKIYKWEIVILVYWGSVLTLMAARILPWRALAIWYSITAFVSLVNALRALGAHTYESAGQPLDRTAQLLDTIDTPGRFWTELWAPVGLRYHAVHHYFPGIPYHNLPEAYRRLTRGLPGTAPYRQTSSPGLLHSLHTLYSKAGRVREARARTAQAGGKS
jgi:fatty acid desaturase